MKPGLRNVRAEALEEIAAMISRLGQLRERERESTIVSAYRAAIDRLEGLAYRLTTRPRPKVYGLRPKQPAEPSPAPEQPSPPAPASTSGQSQRSLPLGPVVVQARRPRRR